jgi:hypothetical protein
VDLTSPWLRGYDVAEKLDKGIAGVTWHGLADDFSGARVERGVQAV